MDTNHFIQFKAPPIPVVNIAFIGLGQRGLATLKRYIRLEHVAVRILCDVDSRQLEKARRIVEGHHRPALYGAPDDWRNVCQSEDIHLVYICTDWQTHAIMAVEAMKCGKHVAVEVPLAMSVDDCWKLVRAAERYRRHCFLLENCCYDPFSLTNLNMVRQGLLGEIIQCEGAYIHDLRQVLNSWMKDYDASYQGNPYPTHGIGPICQLLGIHRGDRLDRLVSMSSRSVREDVPVINNTLIKTVKGVSILLQYDITTPRPYSRLQITCGTKGFTRKYPLPEIFLDEQGAVDATEYLERYEHPLVSRYKAEAQRKQVDNLMNYIMDRRFIDCLRNGWALDISVYDAAAWSCITELSRLSAQSGGTPVEIPDFTQGNWQTSYPLFEGID